MPKAMDYNARNNILAVLDLQLRADEEADIERADQLKEFAEMLQKIEDDPYCELELEAMLEVTLRMFGWSK